MSMTAQAGAVGDERAPLRPETCCHDKPLPCPFCGSEPFVNHYSTLTQVGCRSCGYNIHGHGPESAAQKRDGICYLDIFNHWNKRPTPPAAVSVEALEGLVADWREEAAKTRASAGRAQRRGDLGTADVNFAFAQNIEAHADELTQLIKDRSNG